MAVGRFSDERWGFIEGVSDLITEEFDLYRYHQAERNGVPDKG